MKFDVLITRIGNPKAGNIVSRHIAHETGVSIQVALSQLGSLPVAYSSGVDIDTAKLLIRQLDKIGVVAHAAEVQPQMPPRHASYLADKPAGKPQVVEPLPALPPVPIPAAAPPQTPLQEIPPIEEPTPAVPSVKRFRWVWWAAGVLAALALIFAASRGMFNWHRAFDLDWSKSGLTSSDNTVHKAGSAPGANRRPDSLAKSDSGETDSIRASAADSMFDSLHIPPEQIRMAEAFLDSAAAAQTMKQAISFYKFAIAFNKKNVAAWRGIDDVYKRAGLDDEKTKVEEQMTKLFGEAVFSVASIIDSYGRLTSLSTAQEGTLRMQYRAKHGDTDNALLDAFHLMRDLRPTCNCSAISLYAKTGDRTGLLVYERMESLPLTFEKFRNEARITILK
jgi:hypothetical protein